MLTASTQAVQTIVGQVGFTHVTDVTVIQSLWAGYGKLYSCAAKRRDDETAHLVVKHFAPPLRASDDSEDHLRKMRSYEVESAFYEKLSAKMIDRVALCQSSSAAPARGSRSRS